ncbi:MAG: hypothetical protein GX616_12760 [Planctomycetes bacterium]|nr:hypothetical protein [Planctomycetota bacterium]
MSEMMSDERAKTVSELVSEPLDVLRSALLGPESLPGRPAWRNPFRVRWE